jgi:hypothetical protein
MRKLSFLSLIVAGAALSGCGGNQTYEPTSTVNAPEGDWTIQVENIESVARDAKAKTTRTYTDLGDLTSYSDNVPGFTYPAFGEQTNFGLVSLQGFSGPVILSDFASNSADHIPCEFAPVNSNGDLLAQPSSTITVVPTTNGSFFEISYTIPANYTFTSTTLRFEGTDNYQRVKTVEIPITLENYQGAFAPVTFNTNDGSDSGSLVITPSTNLQAAQIHITFDTNILPTDNVPAMYDNPIPNTVTPSAPGSPVTVNGSPVPTPIQFNWSNWAPGNYAVIAVVSWPITLGGQGPVVRVPCEITVNGSSG